MSCIQTKSATGRNSSCTQPRHFLKRLIRWLLLLQTPMWLYFMNRLGDYRWSRTGGPVTFFKKITSMSLAQRRELVDPTAPGSLRQQCQWVGLHRSVYYRTGGPVPACCSCHGRLSANAPVR
jgi:hypothetical protein